MLFLFADIMPPVSERDNDKCMELHCGDLLYTRAAIIGRDAPRSVLFRFCDSRENGRYMWRRNMYRGMYRMHAGK